MTWAYTIETGTMETQPLQETACWETTTTAENRVELCYNWNRYYDPVTGMYTQVDRITGLISSEEYGIRAMVPESFATYSYAAMNPVMIFDYNGLDWFRPPGHRYSFGREGDDFVPPGPEGRGRFFDDYVPAAHTASVIHDPVIDYWVHQKGYSDWIFNYPTMPFSWLLALGMEIGNTIVGDHPFEYLDYENHPGNCPK